MASKEKLNDDIKKQLDEANRIVSLFSAYLTTELDQAHLTSAEKAVLRVFIIWLSNNKDQLKNI